MNNHARERLDHLDEVDGRYAYYYDGEGGSLVVESATGDTLLEPYSGRWTVLEAVESREQAVEAAREWEAQR